MSEAVKWKELSPGKHRAASRLADAHGRFKMIALDQRTPMGAILEPRLDRAIGFADYAAVKRALVEELSTASTAILVDPEYGLPAAFDALPGKVGLAVTLEDSRFRTEAGGRKSDCIAHWSVEKIKRLGADAVKFLLWYNPDAAQEVVDHQLGMLRRVGAECARYDLAFMVEPLVYPCEGEDSAQSAVKRCDRVLRGTRALADPANGIDIYKLECPLTPQEVEAGDFDGGKLTGLFAEMTAGLPAPWVILSAGASPAAFLRVLDCAYAAGASGYLAGRSIWQAALENYPDMAAVRAALRQTSLPYVKELNRMTDAAGLAARQPLRMPAAANPTDFPTFASGFG